MDTLLYLSFIFLIQSVIFHKITKMQPKIKTKILREIKMHYLNIFYGKKAEFDKKYFPVIIFGMVMLGLLLSIILCYEGEV
ncbi:hypothetical protein ACO3UB_04180 [Methanocaldococcus sp. 16A]